MFAYYMSDACIFLIRKYSGEPFVNIGTCDDISIADFAALVAEVVGFTGRFVYDTSKPDGTPRKLVDVGRLNALGWRSKIPLREGLERTYAWFLENENRIRTICADRFYRRAD